MSLVFVDTGAFLATIVKRDQFHQKAALYYQGLSRRGIPLLTTNYVLVETYTRIRYDDGLAKAIRFHEIITDSIMVGRLRLEWVTPAIHEEAWNIFREYQDHEFSFIDCTSFVVARKAGIQEVFGFDRGFAVMKFTLRPI